VSIRVHRRAWGVDSGFPGGAHDGTATAHGGGTLTLAAPVQARSYVDPHRGEGPVAYEWACWTSPEVPLDFPATDLIPSWNASTPHGSWLEVELSVTLTDGTVTPFYVLGRWAEDDHDIAPASLAGQQDERVHIAIDVLEALRPHAIASYRLRVSLLRRPGSDAVPTVSLLSVTASDARREGRYDVPEPNHRDEGPVPAPLVGATRTLARTAPPTGVPSGRVLDVPPFSQQLHADETGRWAKGGKSWCSPTATSMVLAYWGVGPAPEDYAWVGPDHPDGCVDHAARHVFDHGYGGVGNWTFNTAYAGRYGMVAHVTRLRSMAEAERLIDAGIPLVVSVSFDESELDGAGYSTHGHLLTIIGFDAAGNVVSNDPASHTIRSNDEVRTTYDRNQFEQAWLGRTGGITYVIHPPGVAAPLPGDDDPDLAV
jgi:hypothetical protein